MGRQFLLCSLSEAYLHRSGLSGRQNLSRKWMDIPQNWYFGKCLLKGLFTKIWAEYKEAMKDGAVLRECQGNAHSFPEGVFTS